MERNRTNRRQFIKQTAFALAVPTIISSTAFGKGGVPAPSERVNLGFIGAGVRGGQLLKGTLYNKGAQVVAVSDCFESKRQNALGIIKDIYTKEGREADVNARAYADFREMLAREDIDGVVIATTDHWHVPLSMYAIGAGKDVYVEKPLGVSVDYGFKLRKLVQDKGAVLQYGTQQRSNQYFRIACELARNEYIGKLESIDAWCPSLGYGPGPAVQWPASTPATTPPADIDYERWTGPAPMTGYSDTRVSTNGSYHIYDYALGFIAGWGAHPLDIAQWGNGTDETAPILYEGTGKVNEGTMFDTVGIWDINCKYANGVKMHFMDQGTAMPVVKKYHPDPRDHGTTFHGSDGWVCVSRLGVHYSDEKLRRIKLKDSDVHLYKSKDHISNFVDCIKSRKKPISPIEAAVQSDLISHLSNAAVRLKRPIKWDPKTEKVTSDAKAVDKVVNRKLRKPWKV
ncbi:MAG: Gfo/Idh/MocA family oxidoreductase [Planctomycetes bacterium]|nr:Gfo/Idh/MocA family oxidoreductase [Planctomycetota bacterium]